MPVKAPSFIDRRQERRERNERAGEGLVIALVLEGIGDMHLRMGDAPLMNMGFNSGAIG